MDPVTRDDLTLDLAAWQQEFERRRPEMIAYRRGRRVDLGDRITLDFEDRTTVAWQVNRMLGVENITEPERVDHELATYNILVPGYNELCATMLMGIDDLEELYRWKPTIVGINDKVYLEIDGDRAKLIPDAEGSRAAEEPPMVQYLRWILTEEQAQALRGEGAVVAGIDHPNYEQRTEVTGEVRENLRAMVG